MSRFRIYVRDKCDPVTTEMPLLGEIDTYTDFTAISRQNAVGSWTLKMPAGVDQTSLIAPGRGIVVFRDDTEQNFPVFSGPIRQIDRTWSKDAAGAGTVSVSGPCDNVIVRERLGRVTPDRDWPYEGTADNINVGDNPKPTWTPVVYDPVPTGRTPNNSGEFIYALLVSNFTIRVFDGDWDQSRTVLPLELDDIPSDILRALPNDDAWKGFTVNMADLEQTIFNLADAAGLSVRIQWQAKSKTDPSAFRKNLYVNIEPIVDKSGSVVFDPTAGNVSSYTLSSVAPDATRVIIGAQVTEGSRRWFGIKKNDLFDPVGWIDRDDRDSSGNRRSSTSDGTWGRQKIEVDWNTDAETFLDARDIQWEHQIGTDDSLTSLQPTPGSAVDLQIEQAATKALVEVGPKGLLTMTAVDSPACTFGVDYFVSDIVRVLLENNFLPESMRPEDGVIRNPVTEVKLSSNASAIWTIEPTVGTADASPTPYVYKQLKKLKDKVQDTASRNQLDPLSAQRPNDTSLSVTPAAFRVPRNDGPTPPSNLNDFCYTNRPLAGQKFQLIMGVRGSAGDPGYITNADAELMLDTKIGDAGEWVRQTDIQNRPGDSRFWYKDLLAPANVNDVMYIRNRASKAGAVSDWSHPSMKVTVAAGPINSGGTLSLNTPPGVHHVNALFNITGTDTTRGQLYLQIESPVGSGYVTQDVDATYSGASGNTISFPHFVSQGFASTYNIRVISGTEMGLNITDPGTIVKTSNVITINVV